MDLFQYLDGHDFIAFLFWIIVVPLLAWGIVIICNNIIEFFNNLLRSLNITLRGWPPNYLDSLGDYYTQDEDTQEIIETFKKDNNIQ